MLKSIDYSTNGLYKRKRASNPFGGKVELSKSSRSECVKCGLAISIDSLRVRHAIGFFHLYCYEPKNSDELSITDITGIYDLSDENRKIATNWLDQWNDKRKGSFSLPKFHCADVKVVESDPIIMLQFQYLSSVELALIACVSKLWYLTSCDNILWSQICKRTFDNQFQSLISLLPASMDSNPKRFKEMFVNGRALLCAFCQKIVPHEPVDPYLKKRLCVRNCWHSMPKVTTQDLRQYHFSDKDFIQAGISFFKCTRGRKMYFHCQIDLVTKRKSQHVLELQMKNKMTPNAIAFLDYNLKLHIQKGDAAAIRMMASPRACGGYTPIGLPYVLLVACAFRVGPSKIIALSDLCRDGVVDRHERDHTGCNAVDVLTKRHLLRNGELLREPLTALLRLAISPLPMKIDKPFSTTAKNRVVQRQSAFSQATSAGDLQWAKLLVASISSSAIIDAYAPSEYVCSPLWCSVASKAPLQMISWLHASIGFSLAERDPFSNQTLFLKAISCNSSLDVIEWLLAHTGDLAADLTCPDERLNPLLQAIAHCPQAICALLTDPVTAARVLATHFTCGNRHIEPLCVQYSIESSDSTIDAELNDNTSEQKTATVFLTPLEFAIERATDVLEVFPKLYYLMKRLAVPFCPSKLLLSVMRSGQIPQLPAGFGGMDLHNPRPPIWLPAWESICLELVSMGADMNTVLLVQGCPTSVLTAAIATKQSEKMVMWLLEQGIDRAGPQRIASSEAFRQVEEQLRREQQTRRVLSKQSKGESCSTPLSLLLNLNSLCQPFKLKLLKLGIIAPADLAEELRVYLHGDELGTLEFSFEPGRSCRLYGDPGCDRHTWTLSLLAAGVPLPALLRHDERTILEVWLAQYTAHSTYRPFPTRCEMELKVLSEMSRAGLCVLGRCRLLADWAASFGVDSCSPTTLLGFAVHTMDLHLISVLKQLGARGGDAACVGGRSALEVATELRSRLEKSGCVSTDGIGCSDSDSDSYSDSYSYSDSDSGVGFSGKRLFPWIDKNVSLSLAIAAVERVLKLLADDSDAEQEPLPHIWWMDLLQTRRDPDLSDEDDDENGFLFWWEMGGGDEDDDEDEDDEDDEDHDRAYYELDL